VLSKDSLKGILDLNLQEKLILIPLLLLIIFFGFYPAPLLNATATSSQAIVAQYQAAVGPTPAIVKPAPAAAAPAPADAAK